MPRTRNYSSGVLDGFLSHQHKSVHAHCSENDLARSVLLKFESCLNQRAILPIRIGPTLSRTRPREPHVLNPTVEHPVQPLLPGFIPVVSP
jgi:hypothetical protein